MSALVETASRSGNGAPELWNFYMHTKTTPLRESVNSVPWNLRLNSRYKDPLLANIRIRFHGTNLALPLNGSSPELRFSHVYGSPFDANSARSRGTFRRIYHVKVIFWRIEPKGSTAQTSQHFQSVKNANELGAIKNRPWLPAQRSFAKGECQIAAFPATPFK